MRLHITLPDDLVRELDQRVGPRQRSAFVVKAVESAIDDERRWDLIAGAVGSIPDDHDWDDDPAEWVRSQRRADSRRVG